MLHTNAQDVLTRLLKSWTLERVEPALGFRFWESVDPRNLLVSTGLILLQAALQRNIMFMFCSIFFKVTTRKFQFLLIVAAPSGSEVHTHTATGSKSLAFVFQQIPTGTNKVT